ncbi:MAG TPA: ABATE domain-containing protein [Myxococcales bacterium]|nr:ABATE domain-containing protein [Myxococcales bacterium]
MRRSHPRSRAESRALFLAGHPALDFLNTRMRVNGEMVDCLQRDDDVLRWLERAGFAVARIRRDTAPLSLVDAARTLRENIRSLVENRRAGRRGDPSVLNRFLAEAQSHPRLVWNEAASPKIDRVRRQDTPAGILGPVAEAAADLLASADFTLVKRCEDKTCVLWFSDQTKSHHRRWCSPALCGNRYKVAAYRKRLRARSA